LPKIIKFYLRIQMLSANCN